MLTVYVVGAAVGGLLILLSLLGGDHGSHEHSVEIGGHFDGHVDHDSDHGDHDGEGPWIPFFSVRFWTYFAMCFGACGLLLTLLVKTPEPLATFLSVGTGLFVGLTVAFGMRALSRADTDSSVSPKEMLGKEAQVVVAIRSGQVGRVRLSVKGEIIEVLAVTDEQVDIEAGERTVIVDHEGDKVKVVNLETVFSDTPALNA